jgi:sugar phosphate isomerase/epimerase
MKRSEFIIKSTFATAGALWLSSCGISPSAKPIGLQLYTLRDMLSKDVMGTLELLAKIGYEELEAWGYSEGNILGRRYTDFANEIQQLGMKLVSSHFDTGQSDPTRKGTLTNGWGEVVDDAKTAGQQYMVIGWLDEVERNSIDAIKRTCERLNKGGEISQQAGIRLGFHNHLNEFARIDNQILYDVMLKELDPKYVAMELDLYWMVLGGFNPVDYIKKYPGRFELLHVKDMDKTDKNKTIDVGSGSINFPEIFAAASEDSIKHYFIEQENFTGPADESVRKGFNYLNDLLN